MFFTLGEAAKRSGLSKATISRAIRDGKLSATKSADTSSYKIDPAELHRYTEAVQVVRNTVAKQNEEQAVTHYSGKKDAGETSYETLLQEVREQAELETRAKLAEARLDDLKAQLEEIKGQRDKWQAQAERLLLSNQTSTMQRRGLFDWFKRAG